jgi:hypothetical protein
MMAILGTILFIGVFAIAAWMIATAIAPQWRRILRLASGQVEAGFAPLQTLVAAERRIAVRRWALAPMPARRLRAAA